MKNLENNPEPFKQPRADIKFIAYICLDNMSDKTPFTCHRTALAAEKRYGDLGRFYRGSASSDYELIVLSVDEAFAMVGKDIEFIDWDKKLIHWG